MKKFTLGIMTALAMASAVQAHAASDIIISEVAPWSSSNSPVGADWFELTNMGSSVIDITGWKMDDNSNAFASSVALGGVTSIAAGQSVVFVEGNAGTVASFVANWFGGSAPAGVRVGYYSGSGVGLGTGGDAVNIFNASGVLQAKVTFGASDSTSPYQTFDNAAGLHNAALSQLSVVGVNGAFMTSSGVEVGSPGAIAAVPEPSGFAMLMAGLAMLGFTVRRFRSREGFATVE